MKTYTKQPNGKHKIQNKSGGEIRYENESSIHGKSIRISTNGISALERCLELLNSAQNKRKNALN